MFFSGKSKNKREILGMLHCDTVPFLIVPLLQCSRFLVKNQIETILPANKHSRSWSIQNQALPNAQKPVSAIHRRNSIKVTASLTTTPKEDFRK